MTNNDADQKARRRVLRVECSGQMGLFKQARHPQAKHRESLAVPTLRFVDPDPETLALGDGSLRHYLASMSLGRAFVMRDFFDSLDWSAFDARYKPGGRPPYAPRRIVSLIIYGISVGCTSLRTLESLARRDLVAHWLTGGMCPDHSKIGRFINLHQRELSGALFESMTAAVLKEMPEINREISGDGTIIEAAASRYTRVKKEAIERWEHEAQKKKRQRPQRPSKTSGA